LARVSPDLPTSIQKYTKVKAFSLEPSTILPKPTGNQRFQPQELPKSIQQQRKIKDFSLKNFQNPSKNIRDCKISASIPSKIHPQILDNQRVQPRVLHNPCKTITKSQISATPQEKDDFMTNAKIKIGESFHRPSKLNPKI
jgi:hypothetical protein